ncbi:MAG: carbohydrate ABC transporter permease [Bavariicoccus seileri]|uniref:carbohydrate ABC transporter permease n=1 Tax=Bavariicoccus seileri TaxID=549685 RepID=UPI003F9DA945
MKTRKNLHFILVAIIGIAVSLVWLYPFLLIFINSFKSRSEILTNVINLPKNPTFVNYPTAFRQMNYWGSFLNSLIITVISVVLIILFSAMAAYALSRNDSKLSKILYFVCGSTMLIPFQSVMIPLVGMFGSVGMLNRTGLIIMNIGFSVSMSIFLYYGSLRGVSISLDEAAYIDGASYFKTFFKVILPTLRSTTVTVIILNGMKIWNDYLLPSLVVNKDGMFTLPLEIYYFFGQYTTQWELALTGLLLAIVPIILLYIFLQQYIVQGIAEGAIK